MTKWPAIPTYGRSKTMLLNKDLSSLRNSLLVAIGLAFAMAKRRLAALDDCRDLQSIRQKDSRGSCQHCACENFQTRSHWPGGVYLKEQLEANLPMSSPRSRKDLRSDHQTQTKTDWLQLDDQTCRERNSCEI